MPLLVFVMASEQIVCAEGHTFGCVRLRLGDEMSSIFYQCCFAASVFCEGLSDKAQCKRCIGDVPNRHAIEEDPAFIVMSRPSPSLVVFCRLETPFGNSTVEQCAYGRI